MNNLLLRQIKRRFGSLDNIPDELKDFIQDINVTYKNFEDDVQLLQNSIEISSVELRDALIKQKYNTEKQNETIGKIKEAIIELNPTIHNVEDGLISSDSTYLFKSLIRLIEERKQMEIALQNTMIRNKALLDANPDIMLVLDRSCIFKDFHTNNNELLYVQPSHFIGFEVSKVLPEHIALMIQEKVKTVIFSKRPEYLTYQMEIQGSVKFFEARFVIHGTDEVLVIVSDITQRKITEKALNESEE
jgi:PAS domain-containing protein